MQTIAAEVVRTAGNRAVLVGVLTVNGVRKLIFYARESDWIEQSTIGSRNRSSHTRPKSWQAETPDQAVFKQFVEKT